MAKFRGNMLSLSENIAKCFRGATFLTHTVDSQQAGDSNHKPGSRLPLLSVRQSTRAVKTSIRTALSMT